MLRNPISVFNIFSSPHPKPSWFVKMMSVVCLLAVLLRLTVIAFIPTQPVSDFWSFFTRANNLHDMGTYEAVAGRRDATFPPLYSLFLSASFSIPVDRLLMAKLINIILGVFSIVIIAELSFVIAGPRVGITAALIHALYPRSVLMPLIIASENLFIPLLLLWALLTTLYLLKEKVNFTLLILIGVVSGLLTLTKSVALLLWLIIPCVSLAKKHSWSRVITELIGLVLVTNLVLLPWGIRNQDVLGRYSVLSSSGGVDLFIGNNPNATGFYYAWQNDMLEQDAQFFQRTITAQDEEARNLAWDWIWENPAQAAQLYAIKFVHMFSSERYVEDFAITYGMIEPPWPAAAPLPLDHPLREHDASIETILNFGYFSILLLELAGTGFLFFKKQIPDFLHHRWTGVFLFAAALYFPITSAIFHSMTRYRWPFTDLLIPLAALMIVHGSESIICKFSRRPLNRSGS